MKLKTITRDDLLAMHARGMSVWKIAMALGTTRWRVQQALRRWGIVGAGRRGYLRGNELPARELAAWLRGRFQGQDGSRRLLLGEVLRCWRVVNRLEVREAGVRLGVEPSTLSRLELGRSLPSSRVLGAVLRALMEEQA